MDVPACGRECPGFEAFGQLSLEVACRKQEAPGEKRAEFLFHVHDSWFKLKVRFHLPFSASAELKLRLALRSAQSKGSFSRSFLRLGRTQTSFGSALGSIERFLFFELLQVLSGLFAGLQGKNKWLSRSGRFCLRTKARLLGCCMATKRRHFCKIFIIKIMQFYVKIFFHAGQRNVVCLYGSFFRSCLNLFV